MYRAELVHDPILIPIPHSSEQQRWAAFCAASVEYLCKKYAIACPDWVYNPVYALAEPWYYAIGADLSEVQEELRRTTPEEFTKRNIFCGNRTFNNKYEKNDLRRRAAQEVV